jgi:hypothetical protein
MFDKLLALISVASLIGFIGILIYFVAEPDLTIICMIVLVMAVFDFYLLTKSKPPETET